MTSVEYGVETIPTCWLCCCELQKQILDTRGERSQRAIHLGRGDDVDEKMVFGVASIKKRLVRKASDGIVRQM